MKKFWFVVLFLVVVAVFTVVTPGQRGDEGKYLACANGENVGVCSYGTIPYSMLVWFGKLFVFLNLPLLLIPFLFAGLFAWLLFTWVEELGASKPVALVFLLMQTHFVLFFGFFMEEAILFFFFLGFFYSVWKISQNKNGVWFWIALLLVLLALSMQPASFLLLLFLTGFSWLKLERTQKLVSVLLIFVIGFVSVFLFSRYLVWYLNVSKIIETLFANFSLLFTSFFFSLFVLIIFSLWIFFQFFDYLKEKRFDLFSAFALFSFVAYFLLKVLLVGSHPEFGFGLTRYYFLVLPISVVGLTRLCGKHEHVLIASILLFAIKGYFQIVLKYFGVLEVLV